MVREGRRFVQSSGEVNTWDYPTGQIPGETVGPSSGSQSEAEAGQRVKIEDHGPKSPAVQLLKFVLALTTLGTSPAKRIGWYCRLVRTFCECIF